MRNTTNSSKHDWVRQWIPGWLAVLAMVLYAGVLWGAEPPAVTDPTGTYALHSVDGKEVPCDAEHDGHKMNISSGQFTIKADGTCSSRMVFSVESGPETTRQVQGLHTLEGSTLTMKWRGGGTTTGTVDEDTFTMTNEGMVLVYKK